MTNPFENENGIYHVLINKEGQHSLWPAFLVIPEGWSVIYREESRQDCLEYINKNWTDLLPNSLKLVASSDGTK
ncbi:MULTISPECIES: MbtH family protein [Peribacillus]|uniref:MbtH family protein n=1 Tax=Peribacillus TaxID=2675229 RepID=UPI001F4DA73C|nr:MULTISPECIES: MbtH family protein [unclassified Peribacillus]MCK1986178.1 MbtH family protein [Peribacillus sp. Aquil_B1]MCK2010938.1 MbtH family protein [Peribacillus sp. Aquil_B8]